MQFILSLLPEIIFRTQSGELEWKIIRTQASSRLPIQGMVLDHALSFMRVGCSIKIACASIMADCWRGDTYYFPTAAAALHIPVRLTTRVRSACSTRCGFRVFSLVIKPRGSYATPLSFIRNGIYFRHLGNMCVVARIFPQRKKSALNANPLQAAR